MMYRMQYTSSAYCSDMLKSLDVVKSNEDNDGDMMQEVDKLLPKTVEMLNMGNCKTSLLMPLEDVSDKKLKTDVGPSHNRWGPVLVQKPNTKTHGNINNMAKATAYQRKKNLEVPTTFRGNSVTILSNDILMKQVEHVDLSIGDNDHSKQHIISGIIEEEKELCLAFANVNPGVAIPDNLDSALCQNLNTPARSFPFNPVGTVGLFEKSHAILTKTKPCGLSHPFRIS